MTEDRDTRQKTHQWVGPFLFKATFHNNGLVWSSLPEVYSNSETLPYLITTCLTCYVSLCKPVSWLSNKAVMYHLTRVRSMTETFHSMHHCLQNAVPTPTVKSSVQTGCEVIGQFCFGAALLSGSRMNISNIK